MKKSAYIIEEREQDAKYTDMPVWYRYATILNITDAVIVDRKLGDGFQSEYTPNPKFYDEFDIVTEKPSDYDELIRIARIKKEDHWREMFIEKAEKYNEAYALIPKIGDRVHVIKGRKNLGKTGTIERFCVDLYVNDDNFTRNSYKPTSFMQSAILAIASHDEDCFMRDRLEPLLEKSLVCRDDNGEWFFEKPKRVKILTPIGKSQDDIDAWVESMVHYQWSKEDYLRNL